MQIQVNGERLNRWVGELAEIGKTVTGGVTRFALTAEDRRAREWLCERASEYGLGYRFDSFGNLFIFRPDQTDKPVLLVGSHLDTVPEGGRYDGALGVLSAFESLVCLQESQIVLDRAIEVVVWTEEEGSRFKGGLVGSRAFIGELPQAELMDADDQGITLGEALAGWGLQPESPLSRALGRELVGYLELHIEQGGVLERLGQQIGVVSGIVGIRRFDLVVTGQANHAGTTPMALRRDALVGVAEMVQLVPARLLTLGFPQAVATVGKLQVFPGGVNVVPGRVEFALEVRDLESEVMSRLADSLLAEFEQIASRHGLDCRWKQTADVLPAPLDERMREAIRNAAIELGYRSLEMPSGAGHDAQHLAQICPTGMIFVPSKGGISHSPLEFTSEDDCVRGANTLLNAILGL